MNEQEKQKYLEEYRKDKEKGVPFFPDIIFKDAVVALIVFLLLVALAYFIGTPLEERANPADTSYTPRPEWYFLFLFQLLKYFPGRLEFLGVVLLPTLAIILLLILPLLDRNAKRHPANRLLVVVAFSLLGVGIVYLTVQAYREAPPPAEVVGGDPVAALYTKNCAGCHGPNIQVPAGTNLHQVIAQGKHEGMPAWSADLSSDQIDALAGFILSPLGSQLFTNQCGSCHEAPELIASNPIELKNALEQGPNYPPHEDLEIPQWDEVISHEERTALLNFLLAPDGQRLFVTNCSDCHGRSVAFSGSVEDLTTVISQGGLHLEMPPWKEKLTDAELDTLANYVVDPSGTPDGAALFNQNCSACHGQRIPRASGYKKALEIISGGGAHETMPVWGDILTADQINALVSYTMSTAEGKSLEAGQELFAQNCSPCHGDFGEGGPNPARAGDIIAPISTGEYLKTRDDYTLRAIIAQGQPNFGMSPFGSSAGGPLDDDQIDTIVSYMRSWETNPPVELPPEVTSAQVSVSGSEIYQELCAQCHGLDGEGGIGPALREPEFQASVTDEYLFDTINKGHAATSMIGWGEILSADQIQQLVDFIRQLKPEEGKPAPTPTAGPISFSADILPIFKAKCIVCHGKLGGWDGSNYDAAMSSGDHAPVILPGDAAGSLLAQKLLGTQTVGEIMPPAGKLSDDEIQTILQWIESGAQK